MPRPLNKQSFSRNGWFWLDVLKTEKEEVKPFGARWDAEAQKWFAPKNAENPLALLPWIEPGQLVSARPGMPVIALVIDGYHLIYASGLRHIRHSEDFDRRLKLAILQVINTLHVNGLQVGQVNFHHAAPLDSRVLPLVERDAQRLGIKSEPIIRHYQKAYHAVEKLAGHSSIEGIPFCPVLGRTRYNGFRLDSRAIATLPQDSALMDALELDVKQKAVDTTLVLDLLYFAELRHPSAAHGFVLVATDTDFVPAVERACELAQHHAVQQRRSAQVGWVGINAQDCPYPAILPHNRFTVAPTHRRRRRRG